MLQDAIKKRLGRGDNGTGIPTRLTGPETSAAIMASDFLLKELDNIVEAAKESEEEGSEEQN